VITSWACKEEKKDEYASFEENKNTE